MYIKIITLFNNYFQTTYLLRNPLPKKLCSDEIWVIKLFD